MALNFLPYPVAIDSLIDIAHKRTLADITRPPVIFYGFTPCIVGIFYPAIGNGTDYFFTAASVVWIQTPFCIDLAAYEGVDVFTSHHVNQLSEGLLAGWPQRAGVWHCKSIYR